jgi:hypothetical protein
LWFGQVWEVGVEGAVKWSHSFGESLLFLVHGVDYIPLGDGSLFVCGGRGYPPKKTYPFKRGEGGFESCASTNFGSAVGMSWAVQEWLDSC